MYTRMPQFGEPNLRHLPDLLSRLDSLKRVDFLLPKPESNNPKEQSREKEMRAGWRELVGDRALNCIACHSFDGQASNQRGIDLMVMTQRLQPGWYYQYMINLSAFRPRTVMPTSWPDGKAVFTTSDRCVPVTKMGCCTEMRITRSTKPRPRNRWRKYSFTYTVGLDRALSFHHLISNQVERTRLILLRGDFCSGSIPGQTPCSR